MQNPDILKNQAAEQENWKPEIGVNPDIIQATIVPRIIEYGKTFNETMPSDYLGLRCSSGTESLMDEYCKTIQVPLSNPDNTVTFGYLTHRQQHAWIIQTVNLSEDQFGGTNDGRPVVQKRISILDMQSIIDLYRQGIRPLAGILINAYPEEQTFLLERYETAKTLPELSLVVESNVKFLWQAHQNEEFRRLAIQTTDAILGKRASGVGNPVILEHQGQLSAETIANLIDTVNVMTIAMSSNMSITAAISRPLTNNGLTEFVIKNVNDESPFVYGSYVINRAGKEQEISPANSAIPTFRQTPGVVELYDKLHGNQTDWVKNHQATLSA